MHCPALYYTFFSVEALEKAKSCEGGSSNDSVSSALEESRKMLQIVGKNSGPLSAVLKQTQVSQWLSFWQASTKCLLSPVGIQAGQTNIYPKVVDVPFNPPVRPTTRKSKINFHMFLHTGIFLLIGAPRASSLHPYSSRSFDSAILSCDVIQIFAF